MTDKERAGGWRLKFVLPDISHNDGMFIFIAYYFIYFIFCFNRELVQLTVTKLSTYVSTTQSTNHFYGCIQYNPYRRLRDGKFTATASSRRRRKPIYLRVLSILGGILGNYIPVFKRLSFLLVKFPQFLPVSSQILTAQEKVE